MTIDFIVQNPSTTKELIQKFEDDYAFKLPKEYKQFLIATNGGQIDYGRIEFIQKGVGKTFATVTEICGLHKPKMFSETTSLHIVIDNLKEHLPENVIPIADEIGGHIVIVMSLSLEDFGSVYLWMNQQLTKIGTSFNKFLDLLEFEH